MKIVFATDNYWPRVSGLAVSLDTFKTELEKLGNQVHILCPIYKGIEKGSDLPRVHRFPAMRIPFSTEDRLVRWRSKRLVWAVLDRIKPDIIHIHSEVNMGKFCLEYAHAHAIPVVITAHTHWIAYLKKYAPFLPMPVIRRLVHFIASKFYNGADLNLTPTEEMRNLLIAQKQLKEVAVLPTGINRCELEPESGGKDAVPEYFSHLPDRSQTRVLLYTGRIGPEKNLIFLFRVFLELLKKRDDLHFVLAGDGPYRKMAERICRRTGLRGKATFLGYLPRRQMARLYEYAHLFIFASRTETQGLVPLEAMMCGTPVVALGKMGVKDIIGPQRGGLMAEDNIQHFAACVNKMLDDPDLLAAKGREALEYAQEWRGDVLAGKLADHYRNILTKRAKRGTIGDNSEESERKESV